MQVFRFLEMKILLVFAEVFKIQKNIFLEIISMTFSLGAIALLSWACYKLFKAKKLQYEMGFKRIRQNVLLYASIGLNAVLMLFFLLHVSMIIYLTHSHYQLSDFTFHQNELSQELLNVDIYDKNGNKVYTMVNNGVNRETVSMNQMPSYLPQAFVDAEDKNFYQHAGVSITGYIRAIVNKIIHPSMNMNGGSTLTQQLVKNVNGNMYGRTILQKYQEALMSIILENEYTKNQILEMYLNRIYLGNGDAYGVGTAAKEYFNKNVSQLTLAQSAYLAGLPQAPSSYTTNLTLGNQRKNIVLNAMKKNGSITESQWEKATQETIVFTKPIDQKSTSMDAYVDYVLKEAQQDYGITEDDLKNKGYSIYTFMDKNLQDQMYQAAQNFHYADDQNAAGKKVQVGMAAVDNNTNKIIALYGGRDYIRGYLNRADSYYQPGSIIKPLAVYGPAFETKMWSPLSIVQDVKRDFNGYSPKNAENIYEGPITVERALIRSANIPAVTVMQDVGVDKGVESLQKLGIEVQPKDKELSLALGGMQKGVTPIQMAQAYTVFPNDGYFEPAKAIAYIIDKHGNFVQKKPSATSKGIDVFSPSTAYHMTEILEKVITDPNGTGKNAYIGRPVAGKTGTAEEAGTTGNRASWFVGYTPDITMAVHLGFDQTSDNLYLSTAGGGDPAKLFSETLTNTLAGTPAKDFIKPEGVKSIEEESVLSKVENVKARYDGTNKQVTLSWDKEKTMANVVYKVYKKGENGKDILVGTTSNATFNDQNLFTKKQLEAAPIDSSWKEKEQVYLKNIATYIQNNVVERNTYYVIATYQNQVSKPSDTISVIIPTFKK